VIRDPSTRLMILPQKAYLPLGTLRQILSYPSTGNGLNTPAIVAALDRVGLAHLAPRLDDAIRWDQSLSNGERQRIGVARILLQKPDIAVIDDAISALDDGSRDRLILALRQDCPKTAFVTFGQKPVSASNLATSGGMRHVSLVETSPQTSDTDHSLPTSARRAHAPSV
jgi:vitamin B12/bleomycin/antimicrobial peptide transport system ATP-binding/permease protein